MLSGFDAIAGYKSVSTTLLLFYNGTLLCAVGRDLNAALKSGVWEIGFAMLLIAPLLFAEHRQASGLALFFSWTAAGVIATRFCPRNRFASIQKRVS